MNPWAILAVLAVLAGLGSWGTYESGRADKLQGQMDSLKAQYATAAASAITHAQAITAKNTKVIQAGGTTAVASAATKTQAIQVRYKTIYLPSLNKLDPKDEASKCAGLPVPNVVLNGLSNGPGS